MNLRKIIPLMAVGAVMITSCSTNDDPVPKEPTAGAYDNGVFIVNEGNFGAGNSTISFLKEQEEEVVHQIFRKENEGKLLGDTSQNMAFYKDYAFIVMNVSNTIVVVDRHNFQHVITIEENLDNPRFITFSEGKAFVTNWGDGMDPDDDFVSVFNAETFASVGKISVPEGPERIVAGPGKVFAAHKGGFNVNDKVSVIDAVKSELTTTIIVGKHPNSLVVDGDYVWVLSGGVPSYTGDETAGSLSKIDMATLKVTGVMTFPESTNHPANLDLDNERFYYTLGKEVYSFGQSETSFPTTADFGMTEVEILYGFEVKDSQIYVASASSDFSSEGKLFLYDLKGNLQHTFDTGVNPNGIYFND